MKIKGESIGMWIVCGGMMCLLATTAILILCVPASCVYNLYKDHEFSEKYVTKRVQTVDGIGTVVRVDWALPNSIITVRLDGAAGSELRDYFESEVKIIE